MSTASLALPRRREALLAEFHAAENRWVDFWARIDLAADGSELAGDSPPLPLPPGGMTLEVYAAFLRGRYPGIYSRRNRNAYEAPTKPPAEDCQGEPGSLQKIEALAAREKAGQTLWHAKDSRAAAREMKHNDKNGSVCRGHYLPIKE